MMVGAGVAQAAAMPIVTNPTFSSITDTSAHVDGTVDPQGADTTWQVQYASAAEWATTPNAYPHSTPTPAPVIAGTTTGPQPVAADLTGLAPGTTYHVVVDASNTSGDTKSTDQTLTTAPLFSGTEGSPTSVNIPLSSCPAAVTVDWGDGSTSTGVPVTGCPATPTLNDSHTYAEDGTYTITVTDPASANATVGTGYAQVAEVPIAAQSASPLPAPTAGQSFTGTVATFTDANTSSTPSEFTASINWGDGTTTAGTITGSAGNFTVTGTHAYGAPGPETITVTVTDTSGGTPTTATDNITVGTQQLAPGKEGSAPGGNIGLSGGCPGPVTVDWGDGTAPQSITPDCTGATPTIPASHIYAEDGTYTIKVTDPGNAGATVATASAQIAEVPIAAQSASPVPAPTAGVSFTGPVATFTDPNTSSTPSEFTASINWGDGTTTAGTITGSAGNFTVGGTHTYGAPGPETISVTVTDTSGGTPATATDNITVASQQVAPGNEGSPTPVTISLSGGCPGPVTVDWGDGTTPQSVTPDCTGATPTVNSSHTYAEDGGYTIKVTDPGNAGATVATASIQIAEVPIAAQPASPVPAPTVGHSFTGTVATFTDPNTSSTPSEFTASINWGDGTTTAGTITGSAGSFTVTGTHTYTISGAHTITVTITDTSGGAPATVTDNITVGTVSQQFTGTEGTQITPTINLNGHCPPSVNVNWGDGTTSTGLTPSGCPGTSPTLNASHTYAEDGSYTITVTDPSNVVIAKTGAEIGEAAITPHSASVPAPTAGQSFTATLATFTDANTSSSASNFTASINWGDGTTTAGTVTGSGGSFTVTGAHTYGTAGPATITVSITEDNNSPPAVQDQVNVLPPANLLGTVHLAQPYMPARSAPGVVPDRGATVSLTVGSVRRTAVTDGNGNYVFRNVPACTPSSTVTCAVSVPGPGGKAFGDLASVTIPNRASNIRADLLAGRISDRFFLAGSVLPPGAITGTSDPRAGNATPFVNVTMWLQKGTKLEELYDARRACAAGRWGSVTSTGIKAPKCNGTAGSYLLSDVPLPGTSGVLAAASTQSARVIMILLEATSPTGAYVPVDSATVNLPANTGANNVKPPLTVAPTLHEVLPVPKFGGGHTVGGRVTRLQPFLPHATAPAPVGVAGAQVVLTMGSGKTALKRKTRTDRSGNYAFSGLPACPRRGPCTVAVLSGVRGNPVEDQQRVHFPSANPSVTVVDLTGGRVASRFFARGRILPPPHYFGPMPITDLKITPAGNGGKSTYDALATCSKGGWGAPAPPACAGTVGGYLLDKIPVAVPGQRRGAAHTAKITLLERNARGKFVPVASASIRLPADTPANNRRAPIIHVPDLTAVAHLP